MEVEHVSHRSVLRHVRVYTCLAISTLSRGSVRSELQSVEIRQPERSGSDSLRLMLQRVHVRSDRMSISLRFAEDDGNDC